jgi:hypothetical protein
MKYIKIFEDFESNEDKIEDLIQLCLVELTDNNFKVEVSTPEFPRVFKSSVKDIRISKESWDIDKDRLFDYNDVKDHLITFIKLLSKDYEIDHVFFMGDWKKKSWLDKKIDKLKGSGPSGSREREEVSVEDLISDKTKINFQLISITIKIK